MNRLALNTACSIATLVVLAATTRAATTTTFAPQPLPIVGDCQAPQIVTELVSVTPCIGDNVTMTVVASGTNLTYSWFQGEVPRPFTTASINFPNITIFERGLWCVIVTNECGTASSCARITINDCGGTYCSLTQGGWGNANGQINGISHLQALTNALAAGNLVLGKPGRSVTFTPGAATAQCIVDRMPSGSTATTLPDFGDQTFLTAGCNTTSPLPLKNDRFKNILLGQTLTLALNLRLSPNLANLNLCAHMGTDAGNFHLSQSVLDEMLNQNLGHTTAGLLELANRALAGWSIGSLSLSDITRAVDAINNGFDECVVFTGCIE